MRINNQDGSIDQDHSEHEDLDLIEQLQHPI